MDINISIKKLDEKTRRFVPISYTNKNEKNGIA